LPEDTAQEQDVGRLWDILLKRKGLRESSPRDLGTERLCITHQYPITLPPAQANRHTQGARGPGGGT